MIKYELSPDEMEYSPSAGEESESLRSRVPQILIFKYRQIYSTTGRGSLKFLTYYVFGIAENM